MEALSARKDLEAMREVLRGRDVLQYFFPAADHLALGLVDRGAATSSQVVDQLEEAPRLGHPYGALELVPAETNLGELVGALQAQKFLVEGEAGFELTPDGESRRATVRFQPREGLLQRL